VFISTRGEVGFRYIWVAVHTGTIVILITIYCYTGTHNVLHYKYLFDS
jgi:hypothetical protein